MKNYELQFIRCGLKNIWGILVFSIIFGLAISINAQSTSSEYPTPIKSNEISGKISARDIGDSRLTAFYYVFNGTQGDVFINVESSNFNGDIDVFAAEGLRPLTKIRLYADNSPTETGRIVYLRKPEKLILKLEGRTPDDNPATFTIKFAGSFAIYEGNTEEEPKLPEVKKDESGSVRVNSVGTIIEEKKDPISRESRIAENKKEDQVSETKTETNPENPAKVVVTDETADNKKNASENDANSKVESTESIEKKKETIAKKAPVSRNGRPVRKKTVKPPVSEEKTEEAKIEADAEKSKTTPANPLENVRLVVLMKNSDKFEYPMTEVFRFSLNNNVLTIILKNGKIERRSIFDIQKFSVE